jgi:lipoate-protein ligase A
VIQAWKSSTVLQHGSIQLNPNPNLWQQVFQAPLPNTPQSLPSSEEIMTALLQALIADFGITCVAEPLVSAEQQALKTQPSLSPVLNNAELDHTEMRLFK